MALRARNSRDLLGFVFSLFLIACGSAPSVDPSSPVVSVDPGTPATSAALAPAVVRMLPAEAMVVEPSVVARLVFSEAMDPATSSCLTLSAADGRDIPVTYAWDVSGTVAALSPDTPLAEGEYVLVADACAASRDGIAMENAVASGFTVHVPKDSKGG